MTIFAAARLQTKDVWWITWDRAGHGIQDEIVVDGRETAEERIEEIRKYPDLVAGSISLREVTEIREIVI